MTHRMCHQPFTAGLIDWPATFFDHDDVESGLGAGRSIISGSVGQPLIRTASSWSERSVGARRRAVVS
jgi:hypothetical protein